MYCAAGQDRKAAWQQLTASRLLQQQVWIYVKQALQAGVRCAQGALPGLVGLLKRYVPFGGPPNSGASVVRRAADAITNLAHENVVIKSKVRAEGGIPPLVCLLESYDAKVRGDVWLGSLAVACGVVRSKARAEGETSPLC